MTDEQIARVVHEAMCAFRLSLGQDGYPGWDACEPWMRESSVAAVAFRRENPDAPHSSQHDQWAEQKRASGWSYGAVRDDAAKKHPMLIPYDELPPEERQKDALVSAIVRALMEPADSVASA